MTESDCDYIDTAQQFIHAELALLNIVIKIGRAYNIDVKAMINKMGTFYSILYFGVKDKKSSQTRTKKKKDLFKNSTKKKLSSTSKLESIFSYDVDKARLIYQFALLVKAFEISEDKYLAAITRSEERRVGKEGLRLCRCRWSP